MLIQHIYQSSLLENFDYEKDRRINDTIDKIRLKYDFKAVGL